MSGVSPTGKEWEGRVVDGKFPLQQWLGASGQTAVFLTERKENGSTRAAIKLVFPEALSAPEIEPTLKKDVQLSRWAEASRLLHPHLIRLYEWGEGKIDDRDFLYVVMEYADENLGQILPQRPLTAAEAGEMLSPTAEALEFLHRAGFIHSRIRPSNILAVDNQLKISADSLRKATDRDQRPLTPYDAPEVATTGWSQAADVWSLGVLLVVSLTQREPVTAKNGGDRIVITETMPPRFLQIAQRCLRFDPGERCSVNELLAKPEVQEPPPPRTTEKKQPAKRSNAWFVLPIIASVVLLGLLLLGRKTHQAPILPSDAKPRTESPANAPATQSPVPFPGNATPAPTGIARGRVLHQVSPNISTAARNTITGHLKVNVQVSVDVSGNVSRTRLVSPGPSRYFATQAVSAARLWKFAPAEINGRPAPSEWLLRFQFGRTGTQVFPAETKP